MKFVKSVELNSYINSLFEKHELNLSISDLLLSLINNNEITSKKEISLLSEKFKATPHEIFLDKISQYLDIDFEVEDNEEIYQRYIASKISPLKVEDYTINPYYQNIKIQDTKVGDFELKWDHYFPFELFAYLDMSAIDYIEYNSLGYFDKEFPFITLNYRGVTWMSITPNEIETMRHALNQIKGEVTVFGLGLGYFAYMAINKKEVTHVRVIEKDQKIIDIFNKYLLPQFENKQKLEIIKDDALNYLNLDLKSDYAFVDLWHDPTDGIELYLKFKKSEKNSQKTTYLYWIESSFEIYLTRLMLTLLEENYEVDEPSRYIKANNVEDKIINKFYKQTKSLTISSKADLDKLLNKENLLNLLLND